MPEASPTPRRRRTKGSGFSHVEAMRKQRANPEFKARERLAQNLHKEVVREMISTHRDEYRTLLNEKRVANGLRPIRVRTGKGERRPIPVVPEPVPSEQQKCRHNQGLDKLPYGTFCKTCGKRIR